MFSSTATTITAQRRAVVEIVEGLTEEQLRTPVVPSGWTVLGMVQHLAGAFAVWGDWAIRGEQPQIPWRPTPEGPFSSDHTTAEVLGFLEAAGDRWDRTVSEADADAPPRGDMGPELAHLSTDVETIVAHLLEEVARHAGHLDIARELLDGRTGLGPR
ncbi:mycothiol transferase [Jatrophihabitans sp. YIM 134969]